MLMHWTAKTCLTFSESRKTYTGALIPSNINMPGRHPLGMVAERMNLNTLQPVVVHKQKKLRTNHNPGLVTSNLPSNNGRLLKW